jgi:hypothetical protein
VSCPDCHPAWVAGYETGLAERVKAETEDRARALLVEWSRESRDMATEYASKVGPNWAAMVAGDLDER